MFHPKASLLMGVGRLFGRTARSTAAAGATVAWRPVMRCGVPLHSGSFTTASIDSMLMEAAVLKTDVPVAFVPVHCKDGHSGGSRPGFQAAESIDRLQKSIENGDPSDCKELCAKIAALAKDVEQRRLLVCGGVISALVDALEYHCDDAAVCEAACDAFAQLAEEVDVRIVLAEASVGAAQQVVSILQRHESDADVAAAACRAIAGIGRLSSSSPYKPKADAVAIPDFDGSTVALALGALQRHVKADSTVKAACEAITTLLDRPAVVADAIGRYLPERVMASLIEHQGSATIVKSLCGALTRFASNADGRCSIMGHRSIAIGALMARIVTSHSGDASVARAALDLAARLAERKEDRPRLLAQGVASAALSALSLHEADAVAAASACRLLENFAEDAHVASLLRSAAAPAIASVVAHHSALLLAAGSAEDSAAAASAGSTAAAAAAAAALKAVQKLYRRLASSASAGLPAMTAAEAAAVARAVTAATLQLPPAIAPAASAQTQARSQELARHALDLLAAVCDSESARRSDCGPSDRASALHPLVAAGILPAIVALLSQHKHDADRCKLVLKCIRQLCPTAEALSAFVLAGGGQAVAAVLQQHATVPGELREFRLAVCGFLADLAVDAASGEALDSAQAAEVGLAAMAAGISNDSLEWLKPEDCRAALRLVTHSCRIVRQVYMHSAEKLPTVAAMRAVADAVGRCARVGVQGSSCPGTERVAEELLPEVATAGFGALAALSASFVRTSTGSRMIALSEAERADRGLTKANVMAIGNVLKNRHIVGCKAAVAQACRVIELAPATLLDAASLSDEVESLSDIEDDFRCGSRAAKKSVSGSSAVAASAAASGASTGSSDSESPDVSFAELARSDWLHDVRVVVREWLEAEAKLDTRLRDVQLRHGADADITGAANAALAAIRALPRPSE